MKTSKSENSTDLTSKSSIPNLTNHPPSLSNHVSFFVLSFLSFHFNQTQEELEKVAREIADLHETLRVKDSALKLSETRLENRTNRLMN
jgi:hypothetical protein